MAADPSNAGAHLLMAKVYAATGDIESATRAARYAWSLDSSNEEAAGYVNALEKTY
jgi:Tfp pilus assembly protein PilF